MFCSDIREYNFEKGTAVALGYFDGLHKGHVAVLKKALAKAENENLIPVVMLLNIHPKKIFTGQTPPMLMTLEKKKDLLEKMGFTAFIVDFEKIMDYTPDEFIDKILVDIFHAKVISCGYDYHFGKGAKGNVGTMFSMLKKRDIEFFPHEPVYYQNEIISSTKIRQLIHQGDIKKANAMLGRPFSYDFEVVSGDKRGRLLGFPTINQFFPDEFVKARFGVYCSKVFVEGNWYPAVTNIGIRPTVKTEKMRSETCILGYSGNLYGQNVEVHLLEFFRDEVKFKNLDDLSQAIRQDAKRAKEVYYGVENDEQIES